MIDTEIEIGGRPRRLKVWAPAGGGGGYHIYIDGYYNGCVEQQNGEWRAMQNEPPALSPQQQEWILTEVKKAESSTRGPR